MDNVGPKPIDPDGPFASMGIRYDYDYPAPVFTKPNSVILDLDGVDRLVFDLGSGEKVELDRQEIEILFRGFPKLVRLISSLEEEVLD